MQMMKRKQRFSVQFLGCCVSMAMLMGCGNESMQSERSEPKLGQELALTPGDKVFYHLYEMRCMAFKTDRVNMALLIGEEAKSYGEDYIDGLKDKFRIFADQDKVSDQIYACPLDVSDKSGKQLQKFLLSQGLKPKENCGISEGFQPTTPSILIVDERNGASDCYPPKPVISAETFTAIEKSFHIESSLMEEVIDLAVDVWPSVKKALRSVKKANRM
tara:strand:- start:470 stop:1120 length:651 start_codon:yes stop_codon:yes gene_type:complete